jgi:hypothetical protein
VGDAAVRRELGRHVHRADHHRVVVVVVAVGGVGVRQVGDPQQEVAQGGRESVGLGRQFALLLALLAALRLQLLGAGSVAVAALQTDLLRQFVHLGTDRVALLLDLTQPRLDLDGTRHLLEQFGLAAAGQRGAHTVGVEAEQSGVDHGSQATCGHRPGGR